MNVKPQLVIDRDTGRVCLQICAGSQSATLPLPEGLKLSDRLGVEAFMDLVVPQMIKGLNERRRAEVKKLMKQKGKDESSSQSAGEVAREEFGEHTGSGDQSANAGAEAAPAGSKGIP